MSVEVKDNEIVINGNSYYCHLEIVGIDTQGNLYEGYDDGFGNQGKTLPKEDQLSLAEHMLERWSKYKLAAMPDDTSREKTAINSKRLEFLLSNPNAINPTYELPGILKELRDLRKERGESVG